MDGPGQGQASLDNAQFVHTQDSALHTDEAVVKRAQHKRLDALSRRNLRVLAVIGTVLAATLLVIVITVLAEPPKTAATGQAWLVESLPVGDFDAIQELPGVLSSWSTLTKMINDTNSTLDVTVMYWDLLAWNSSDAPYFTPAQFKAFGADRGQEMFDAFGLAAKRGVQIRFVQSYSATQLPYELLNLHSRYPNQVRNCSRPVLACCGARLPAELYDTHALHSFYPDSLL